MALRYLMWKLRMRFFNKQVAKETSKFLNVPILFIDAFFDLASTKSCYSPNWRVRNLFGEYKIKVTRRFGEYEIFLMSNPVNWSSAHVSSVCSKF